MKFTLNLPFIWDELKSILLKTATWGIFMDLRKGIINF